MKQYFIIIILVLAGAFLYLGTQASDKTLTIGQPSFAKSTPLGLQQGDQLALSSCTPTSPYTKCLTNDYSYYDARAIVTLNTVSSLQQVNKYKSGYYVGDIVFPAMATPSNAKLYYTANAPSWNILNDCNQNGCNGNQVANPSTKVLATAGNEFKGCPAYYAFIYNEQNGYWAWSTVGYGWVGSNCLDLKSVKCYDETDCGTGQYCDKTSTWQNWACKPKECNTGETKCEGTNNYQCENYKWMNKGLVVGSCNVECANGETKCQDLTSLQCANNKWVSQGLVSGQCGVSSNFLVKTWQQITSFFGGFFKR